jgi:hypothetical protein
MEGIRRFRGSGLGDESGDATEGGVMERHDGMYLKGEGRLTDEVLREKMRHMKPLFGGRRHEDSKRRPTVMRGIARPR